MKQRARAVIAYGYHFGRYVLYVREVLMCLLLIIVGGGFAISEVEGISLSEAMYFSCVTGLTIGYGDIAPETVWGRVLSITIGLVGMIFSGITVAVATRALRDFAEYHREHDDS